MLKLKKENNGLFGGVMTAYLILILHVVLIGAVGFLVLLFGGLVNYMGWVLLAIGVVIAASGYFYYRRIRSGARKMRDSLNEGPFRGRSVEVSLLGGMATFKLGRPEAGPLLEAGDHLLHKQLEDPASQRIRELNDLARLLEEGHISSDEYNILKKQIVQP
jgi:hypothetical protein